MRFFFDNNLSYRLADAIHILVQSRGHEVVALRRKFPVNTPDTIWLERLAKEGDWVILTGDTNIVRNRHEIEAFSQAGLVAFISAKSWKDQKLWDRFWRFIKLWPLIEEHARHAPKSSAYKLPITGSESTKFDRLV